MTSSAPILFLFLVSNGHFVTILVTDLPGSSLFANQTVLLTIHNCSQGLHRCLRIRLFFCAPTTIQINDDRWRNKPKLSSHSSNIAVSRQARFFRLCFVWYDMIRFSKLYQRHTELVFKNNVGFKTLGNTLFQSLYSMAVWFINSKESLEKLLFMVCLKRSSNIIKEWNIAWILCGSLHVWLWIMGFSYDFLFNCTTVAQTSDSITELTKIFNWWMFVLGWPTVAHLRGFFSSGSLWVESTLHWFTVQGSYRQIWVKFNDFSRTSKRSPTVFEELKLMKSTDLSVKILLQKC